MRDNYNNQLKNLCDAIAEIGNLCDEALAGAIKALHDNDNELADKVYKSDYIVDQKEREIEHMCLSIILHQQPIAADLRLVSSALKMITDMERIGDQACDIAEIVIELDYSEKEYFRIIEEMAVVARGMVQDAVKSFISSDLDLAYDVIERDDKVDSYLGEARELMIRLINEHVHDSATILDVLMIAKYLERIADHATNVAKWTIFHVSGEHRKRKGERDANASMQA